MPDESLFDIVGTHRGGLVDKCN